MTAIFTPPAPATTAGPAAPEIPPGPLTPPDSERASLPGFLRKTPRPGPSSPDPLLIEHQHQDDEPAAGSASSEQTASIPAFFRQRSKSYAKIAATLLHAVGGWLNMATEPDTDAFLADADDDETIPPPLGRLTARRIKIGADPEKLTDLEDIAAAAIGLGVWLAKGAAAVLEARRDRRRLERGRAMHSDAGDGAQ